MGKRIFFRPRITEADILKSKPAFSFYPFIFRLFCIHNRRLRADDFLDTFCRNARSRQHNGNHRQHQKRHDDLHRISNKCHHITDLQIAKVYSLSAEPYDSNRNGIHDKHHNRHHESHDPVGEHLCRHQLFIGLIKSFFFIFFTAESSDDRNTCEDLSGNQVHFVHQCLHQLEFRHGNSHQRSDQKKDYADCYRNDPAHARFCMRNLDNASDSQNRCIAYHSKQHDRNHLHLLNIICTSCDQRRRRKFIHFRMRKRNDFSKNPVAQPHTDSRGNSRRQKAYCNRGAHHKNCHQQHFRTNR